MLRGGGLLPCRGRKQGHLYVTREALPAGKAVPCPPSEDLPGHSLSRQQGTITLVSVSEVPFPRWLIWPLAPDHSSFDVKSDQGACEDEAGLRNEARDLVINSGSLSGVQRPRL